MYNSLLLYILAYDNNKQYCMMAKFVEYAGLEWEKKFRTVLIWDLLISYIRFQKNVENISPEKWIITVSINGGFF